jgi:hypothetical protein
MDASYAKLALYLGLSFVIMYAVMFARIDCAGDFYNNINTFYMALIVVAPMGVLMLLLMESMYENQRLNRLGSRASHSSSHPSASAGSRSVWITSRESLALQSARPAAAGGVRLSPGCRPCRRVSPLVGFGGVRLYGRQ